MTILLRVLRTTYQNLFRNGLLTLTAIAIMSLLFALLNAVVFVSLTQQAALSAVSERLDLALTFTRTVEDFQAASLTSELKAEFPAIREVTYISSEEAFTGFLRDFGEVNHEMTSWLERNSEASPLPATLVISAEPASHEAILAYLAGSRYADLLDLSTQAGDTLGVTATDQILTLQNTITKVSIIAFLAFGILAVLIIIAVLRLTLVSRAREITIMRLVGATRQFIRLPFILEGVVFGVAAAVVGLTIFSLFLARLGTLITSTTAGGLGELFVSASSAYGESLLFLGAWQLLAAIGVGILASILATRRYLGSELGLG
jgi:cell division transport system permease protein